jgi:hypothetical protein
MQSNEGKESSTKPERLEEHETEGSMQSDTSAAGGVVSLTGIKRRNVSMVNGITHQAQT